MKYTLMLLTFISLNLRAEILIGSLDSQFDLTHSDLKDKVWVNPHETPDDGIDNDQNGYIDDIHGWNFADHNNILFDPSPTGFPDDIIKYAEAHMRRRAGIASPEELFWLSQNEGRLSPFWGPYVGYMHGTGSASVNVRNTKKTRFVALRRFAKADLIISPPVVVPEDGTAATKAEIDNFRAKFKKEMFDFFVVPLKYAASLKVKMIQIGYLFDFSDGEWVRRKFYEDTGKVISVADAIKIDYEYIDYLLTEAGKVFAQYPEILILLPAGNGSDNLDDLPSFPQGMRLPNVINVGASLFRDEMAPYSNYGKNTVDALIPTVNIYEAVPHQGYMMSSATSVSVLLVTNLAALILEENPKLTALEVKEIILSTTIQKPELSEKVVSGGIIYAERALEAARNSVFMSVEKAIERSFSIVRD